MYVCLVEIDDRLRFFDTVDRVQATLYNEVTQYTDLSHIEDKPPDVTM